MIFSAALRNWEIIRLNVFAVPRETERIPLFPRYHWTEREEKKPTRKPVCAALPLPKGSSTEFGAHQARKQ